MQVSHAYTVYSRPVPYTNFNYPDILVYSVYFGSRACMLATEKAWF